MLTYIQHISRIIHTYIYKQIHIYILTNSLVYIVACMYSCITNAMHT